MFMRAKSLNSREGWKYALLKDFLEKNSIKYQFELPFGSSVFDLALTGLKIFIEFDGPYHANKQKEIDAKKDLEAKSLGWNVIRIKCNSNQIIDPAEISPFLF
jgi:very-short-patch-repair endonuclease